jgi:adenylate cyclase
VKRTAWFRVVVAVLIAALATLLCFAGLALGVFQTTQLRFADALFPSVRPDPRIAIVGVDDRSLGVIGSWPFPRAHHARLIDSLHEQGAALIGYDVTFSEETDASQDEELAGAIADAGNVVIAETATFSGKLQDVPRADDIIEPIEPLSGVANVGLANVIPDPDGVVRALPPIVEAPSGEYLPSLSLALYALAEGLEGPVTIRPDGLQVGTELIPTGRSHLMDINFAEGYPVYSFVDARDGDVPEGAFEDRIVLVGASALGLGDVRLTPLNKSSGEAGVFVHANALNTLLTEAHLTQDPRPVVVAWIFALALAVALAVAFIRVSLSWISPVALGTGYFLLAFVRFDDGTVMNMVFPPIGLGLAFIGALGVRYFGEERERRRVTRVFGRYVAQDVVDEVLAAPENALATLEGASRSLSVLFADLRGFTAASEGADPQDVVTALNAYLDAMVRAVNEERGTIDKFMGDCVMAFWGAPRPTEHHAEHAARAGIRMLDEIDRAVAEGRTAGLRVKGCGVGIATGPAVVGNIGATDRLDYTVIGDTVNTASRLCGVAGPGQIVVTEECAAALKDGFRLEDLPPLAVKGKTLPLRVFQVLREGQAPGRFEEKALLEATEEKGRIEAPGTKAAGYAPIEPPAGEPPAEPRANPRPAERTEA